MSYELVVLDIETSPLAKRMDWWIEQLIRAHVRAVERGWDRAHPYSVRYLVCAQDLENRFYAVGSN